MRARSFGISSSGTPCTAGARLAALMARSTARGVGADERCGGPGSGDRRRGSADGDGPAAANRCDPSFPPGFRGGVGTVRSPPKVPGPTPAQRRRPPQPPRRRGGNPCAAFVAVLTEQMARAVEMGDFQAARVAHDAIGQLLGASAAAGECALMVDASSKRGKRTCRNSPATEHAVPASSQLSTPRELPRRGGAERGSRAALAGPPQGRSLDSDQTLGRPPHSSDMRRQPDPGREIGKANDFRLLINSDPPGSIDRTPPI